MPDKDKKPEFTVTDRRLFSTDGELRQDVVEDEERRAERESARSEAQRRANEERSAQPPEGARPAEKSPPPELAHDFDSEAPSAHEQQVQADAYKQSTKEIDDRIRQEMRKQGQAPRAQDFEMTFEKFIASLYMSALLQLGLAAPKGAQPQVDLIGARQTIDTIALLQEKTRGNLTPAEESMLQNLLYELRMAYLEVTNLITNPPPGGVGVPGKS